ncbi:MAG TPA: hypothetical protein VHB21_04620, partial [Minicystis sp.]|nr:hypothetical protein [Minicystis sp.]
MRRPLLALAFVSAALAAPAARAGGRKGHVRFDAAYAGFPSAKYAALTADGCRAELRARGVAFVDVPRAPGVLAPVRLPRGAGGVLFRTEA